jgi:hypothetical protein
MAKPPAPSARPLHKLSVTQITKRFAESLVKADGLSGAHCIHELWMRNQLAIDLQTWIDALWRQAADSIPDWLPMRHFDWLPIAYETAARFQPKGRGKSNIYLILLDYRNRPGATFGVYVGMSGYTPAARFDQHKAGIRAAGSVLKRGLEPLLGPTLHLQRIPRAAAADIEAGLAELLRAQDILVQGGH